MNKQKQLDEITEKIAHCRTCKKDCGGLPVPGEGNPDADIMFLGEAPGRNEAATGRPFIGRSGQLLRGLIREAGLKESDVYITSPVKYLPDRGTPTLAQIAHGRMHLNAQLSVIQPKFIVLLGKTAVTAMLERNSAILKERGSIIEKDGRHYFITLHPAAVIRFPKYKHLIVEDFKKLQRLVRKNPAE